MHQSASNSNNLYQAQVSTSYLHTNSTSHTWIFGAFAELVDNAYDPGCDAKLLRIDYELIKSFECVTFSDDGLGMNEHQLKRMMGFGFCDKLSIESTKKSVGRYGNGFKSGSMRIGNDVLVFTKKYGGNKVVSMLSQTFLKEIAAETVVLPIVSWTEDPQLGNQIENSEICTQSLNEIIKYSGLFSTTQEILNQFDIIIKQGTRIIIYNLKKNESTGTTELDFFSKPNDILNSESTSVEESAEDRIRLASTTQYQPLYRRSLREYLSILFMKPKLKIQLRGRRINSKMMTNFLLNKETDWYQPRVLNDLEVSSKRSHRKTSRAEVQLHIGMSRDANCSEFGAMLYHHNRLIKPYLRLGIQVRSSGNEGSGVILVADCNHLEPTHNKQEFVDNQGYRNTVANLGRKLDDYYVTKVQNQPLPLLDAEDRKTWDWVQCDSCDKWRRLPFDENLEMLQATSWYCYLNRDRAYNRCDIDEEPMDEDAVVDSGKRSLSAGNNLQPSYKKKKQTRFSQNDASNFPLNITTDNLNLNVNRKRFIVDKAIFQRHSSIETESSYNNAASNSMSETPEQQPPPYKLLNCKKEIIVDKLSAVSSTSPPEISSSMLGKTVINDFSIQNHSPAVSSKLQFLHHATNGQQTIQQSHLYSNCSNNSTSSQTDVSTILQDAFCQTDDGKDNQSVSLLRHRKMGDSLRRLRETCIIVLRYMLQNQCDNIPDVPDESVDEALFALVPIMLQRDNDDKVDDDDSDVMEIID